MVIKKTQRNNIADDSTPLVQIHPALPGRHRVQCGRCYPQAGGDLFCRWPGVQYQRDYGEYHRGAALRVRDPGSSGEYKADVCGFGSFAGWDDQLLGGFARESLLSFWHEYGGGLDE